jgi:hypothetical protein
MTEVSNGFSDFHAFQILSSNIPIYGSPSFHMDPVKSVVDISDQRGQPWRQRAAEIQNDARSLSKNTEIQTYVFVKVAKSICFKLHVDEGNAIAEWFLVVCTQSDL